MNIIHKLMNQIKKRYPNIYYSSQQSNNDTNNDTNTNKWLNSAKKQLQYQKATKVFKNNENSTKVSSKRTKIKEKQRNNSQN